MISREKIWDSVVLQTSGAFQKKKGCGCVCVWAGLFDSLGRLSITAEQSLQSCDSLAVDFPVGARSHCSNMSLCHCWRGELECVHDSTCVPLYAPLPYTAPFFPTAVPVFHTLNERDRAIAERETERAV